MTFNTAGTCVIDANQTGTSGVYAAASQAQETGTATVLKSQSISFTGPAPPTSATVGSSFAVAATAPGGTVSLSIDASSTASCTLSAGTVTFNTAGTCVVDANQAGTTGVYAAATQVTETGTATALKSQSITFTNPAPPTTATVGSSFAVAATGGGSSNPVTLSIDASSTASCTLSAGSVTFNTAGTCVVDANQAGTTGVYAVASQVQESGTATVLKSQSISFTNPAPPTTATVGTSFAVAASGGGSSNPVTLSIDASSTASCTLSAGIVTFNTAGTCVVDANQAGTTGVYTAAPQAQEAMTATVLKSQSISFTNPPPPTTAAVGTSFAVAATGGGSANPVTLSIDASSTASCTLSAGTVTFNTAGTCVVDANQAGATGVYTAAPQTQETGTATVLKSQTISASTAPTGATAGGASYTPTAAASSGLAVTIALDSTSTGCLLSSGGVVSFTAAGTCVIDFTQTGKPMVWAAAPELKQSISIAASFPAGNNELVIENSGLCLDSLGGTLIAGAVFDQWACTGQSNQLFQFVATSGGYGELLEERSGLYVTVLGSSTAPSLQDIVQEPLSYPASQWLPELQSDGSYEFKNKLSGLCLDNYYATSTEGVALDQYACKNAPADNQDFKVVAVKSAQSVAITSTAPSAATVGGATYQLVASSSVGLTPVTFASSTTSVCTVVAATGLVSFVGPGTCSLSASQAGNGSYNAATSSAQSFMVSLPGGFPAGYHKLVIASDSLCLDSLGNTLIAGAAFDQWTCNGQANQEFQFVATSGGYGELQVQSSGLYVTVLGNSTAQGVPDVVQEALAYPASQWMPEKQSDGSFEFKNKLSGLCLDNYPAPVLGTQLDQWPCKNASGNNQDFKPE